MLPEHKWRQYGLPDAKIKGIVVHNTNSFLSAEQLENWMLNNTTSQGCHFLVDHKEVRQVMPLDWSVFSTGKGMDFGNISCVAIEVCTNISSELYLQGERRAVELIKQLMREFNLTQDDIYYHRDFDPYVNCPAQILSRYKTKKEFLNLLKGD